MILQIAIGVIIGGISLVILKAIGKFLFALQQKLPYHIAFDRLGSLRLWKRGKTKCEKDEMLFVIIDSDYL